MQVVEKDTELIVTDRSRRRARITGDWTDAADATPPLIAESYTTHEDRVVRASRLQMAPVGASVIGSDGAERAFLNRGESITVEAGETIVCRTPVPVAMTVGADAEITYGDDATRLRVADGAASMRLGFVSRDGERPGTVRVERSPDGIADYITAAGAATETLSPARTWPNARREPPRISFGTRRRQTATPASDADVSITVPDRGDRQATLGVLYPIATLATYTGADVAVAADANHATLTAAGETFELGADPETVDRRASDWLRRVFYLDCHARAAGPDGQPLISHDVLADNGLDAETLYETPMGERVARYLSLDSTPDRLPEWHYGVHLAPERQRAESLPHLLGRLADVYAPEGEALETVGERMEWSEQVTRAVEENPLQPADVVVVPEQRAATVGWAAELRAVNAVNWSPPTRPHPLRDSSEPISVRVLCSSPELDPQPAADAYLVSDHVDVSVRRGATAYDLEHALTTPCDVVHWIGHSDSGAFETDDGTLRPGRLTNDVQAQTVMLASCGSAPLGERLVEEGAAACVATTRRLGDETARRVESDWARLMARGWSVERALDLVRQVHETPAAFIAVGDGAHTVVESESVVPPLVLDNGDKIDVQYDAPQWAGGQLRIFRSNKPHLQGTSLSYQSTPENQKEFNDHLDSPIIDTSGESWNIRW